MMNEEAGRSKQEVTMEVRRQIADTVFKCLRFTAEVAGGPEKPIPCLDTQLWWADLGDRCHGTRGRLLRTRKFQVHVGVGERMILSYISSIPSQ